MFKNNAWLQGIFQEVQGYIKEVKTESEANGLKADFLDIDNKILDYSGGEVAERNLDKKLIVSPGSNGIPVETSFWDGKNTNYPAMLVGGWERSFAFLSQNWNTNTHVKGLHCAIDIAYPSTSSMRIPVYATHNGIVHLLGNNPSPIYIQNDKIRTVYAHMSNILVKDKEEVKDGKIIGYIGKEGTGYPHLHYEIQFNNEAWANLPNSGEYGVFSNQNTWKSIDVFTYEAEVKDKEIEQPLGRVIPDSNPLKLADYSNYFRHAGNLVSLQNAPLYSIYGGIYTIPRSKALLNWIKKNGY